MLPISHFPLPTSNCDKFDEKSIVHTTNQKGEVGFQKWDVGSENSEVRNWNSEMRNGNLEVRNGNQENLHPISHMVFEKWEMGLKWESPFLKYPPQVCTTLYIRPRTSVEWVM